MPEPGRQITVQINSLALNGFASFDADAFSSALSGELTRLVEQSALVSDVPLSGAWHVETVQISAAAPTNVSAVGVQVARAIYGQITAPQIAAGQTTVGQTTGGGR